MNYPDVDSVLIKFWNKFSYWNKKTIDLLLSNKNKTFEKINKEVETELKKKGSSEIVDNEQKNIH